MSNKKSGKRIVWTKSELHEFAIGLQKYGFSQKEKIAELVSSRDKQEVINYLTSAEKTLKSKHLQRRKAKAKESPYIECKGNYINMESKLAVEVLEGPPIRKWNWMARSQQCERGRRLDYSRISIGDILEDFYDEADTPGNPQVIDVKAIYKFLADCAKGKNPTELMPKESGLVLMLLKKMKEFQDSMDLDEERRTFSDYKGAVKFAPKSEGKKRKAQEDEKNEDGQENSEDDEEMDTSVYDPDILNAVKIDREVYNTFKTHYKLVESFNPLLVHIWSTKKHQTSLEPLMENILGRVARISTQESDT